MRRGTFAFVAAIAATSCAVQKEWIPTGGSRGDGTVKMSYEYGGFEKPVVDESRADAAARQRCSAWGYTSAERFEGIERHCIASNQYGCIRWRMTTTFQCTGQPEKVR